jgi:predicted dithiol-disulfide oxidoreductase (DUF899 family)
MSEPLHPIRFPSETGAYRSARNALLLAERDLRERLESVAALRRQLPLGGRVKEDYVFAGATGRVRLSELFSPGKQSLIVYSFMYGPAAKQACPMCTSFLDGLDRYALHVGQRVDLAVVAKSPIERILAHAATRGWERLRFFSSATNTYNLDYAAETPDGAQIPACNVFTRTPEGIFHFWAAELLYVQGAGHPRHVDLLWPVWSFFDLTPEGRGDWMPKLWYDSSP